MSERVHRKVGTRCNNVAKESNSSGWDTFLELLGRLYDHRIASPHGGFVSRQVGGAAEVAREQPALRRFRGTRVKSGRGKCGLSCTKAGWKDWANLAW